MSRRCLVSILLLFVSVMLSGQDIKKHQDDKQKIEREIKLIDEQLRSAKTKEKASVQQLVLTRNIISSRRTLLSQLDKEITLYENTIKEKEKQIETLNLRLDTLAKYYGKLIYATYKNRDTKIWFMYILASDNMSQGYRRISYLRNLSSSLKKQAEKIRETELQIASETNKLKELHQSSINSKREREREYKLLTKEETEVQRTINQLQRDQTRLTTQMNKKREEAERLDREIERLIRLAQQEQQDDQKRGITIDYQLTGRFEKDKGKIPWPLKSGIITEKFGQHNHPVFPNIKLPFNNGINISTTKNAEVYSVYDGIVKQVLVIAGYNQCVLVQHGEYYTFYCKLNRVHVRSGQQIKVGDTIGILEEDEGNSVLHFEVWKGMDKQNPENWLTKER